MVNFLVWPIVGAIIGWVAGMNMQTGDPPVQLRNVGVSPRLFEAGWLRSPFAGISAIN